MDFATHEACELYLYASSDRESYERHLLPSYQLLERKWRNGVFDRLVAMRWLTMTILPRVARRYVDEFGTKDEPWHRLFPVDVRQEAASHLVDALVNELEIGNSYV